MDKRDDIDYFMQLYQAEWHSKVSSPALDNLAFRKHNFPQLLPFTADLLALRQYVVHQVSDITKSVSTRTNTCNKDWRELGELCLTRLIMFNKRRGRPKFFYRQVLTSSKQNILVKQDKMFNFISFDFI